MLVAALLADEACKLLLTLQASSKVLAHLMPFSHFMMNLGDRGCNTGTSNPNGWQSGRSSDR